MNGLGGLPAEFVKVETDYRRQRLTRSGVVQRGDPPGSGRPGSGCTGSAIGWAPSRR